MRNCNYYNINSLVINSSFDIWSLGVILYQLCHPRVLPLFLQIDKNDNLSDDNLVTLLNWSDEVKLKKLSAIENETAKDLLSLLLSKNPSKRPTITTIISHPFLLGKSGNTLNNDNNKKTSTTFYKNDNNSLANGYKSKTSVEKILEVFRKENEIIINEKDKEILELKNKIEIFKNKETELKSENNKIKITSIKLMNDNKVLKNIEYDLKKEIENLKKELAESLTLKNSE